MAYFTLWHRMFLWGMGVKHKALHWPFLVAGLLAGNWKFGIMAQGSGLPQMGHVDGQIWILRQSQREYNDTPKANIFTDKTSTI